MTEGKKIITGRVFKAFGFLLALVAMLIGLYFAFAPSRGGKNASARSYDLNRIFNERDHSLDALILGHSGVYAGISPMEMYKRYGFTSYDCSQALQLPWETYEILSDVLAVQSPEVVVVETDHFFYDSKSVIRRNNNKRLGLSVYPFYETHVAWKDGFDPSARNALKGYMYTDVSRPFKGDCKMKPSDKKYKLGKRHEKYLKKIYELCRERGTRLCLVELPSLVMWDYEKHNTIREFAETHGINFLDMNERYDDTGINWETDTRDGGNHLNYRGAVKASAYLGEYLKDKYGLPDRKDDPAYSDWREDLNKYEKTVR